MSFFFTTVASHGILIHTVTPLPGSESTFMLPPIFSTSFLHICILSLMALWSIFSATFILLNIVSRFFFSMPAPVSSRQISRLPW